MACERYREALADVAAGAPASAGVEAHIASCEACRAELLLLRQALAMADAEMAGLPTAEPTPELAVRIRQAVAESDLSPAWRFGWLWPATAAAATLLVALAVAPGRISGPTPEPRVAMEAHRPQPAGSTRAAEPVGEPVAPVDRPVPGADQPLSVPQGNRLSSRGAPFESGDKGSAGVAAPPAADSNPAPARSHSAGRRRIPPEPEVLVPPGETDTLLRFAASLQHRAVAPDSLLVADLSAPLAEPRAVEIAPLEIVPLDPTETSGTD
jgi:hypothetical protein